MKLTKYNKILFLILLTAFALRLFKLNELPLYGDELTIAYDSYSLLKTGRDSTGKLLPLTFEMGAGRPAGYVYGSIPFIAIFGPSALGVRMLSVLSSLGIIILIYLLGKKFFNEKVGIIAAVLAMVSPWSLSLSRGGFEAHFALFLALVGVYTFLEVKDKPKFLILWAISWSFAIHTYPTYKLVLPFLFIVLIYYKSSYKSLLTKKNRLYVAVSAILIALFSLVSLYGTFFGISEERFYSLNLFSDPKIREEVAQEVNYDRLVSPINENLKIVFENKFIEYSKLVWGSYLSNFSFDYMFIDGDENPRHNIVIMGNLYWVELFILFAGIYYLSKNKGKTLLILIAWILIVPLATMFLNDQHSLRNSFMLPPLILISSYAIHKLLQRRRILAYFAAVLFLVQFVLILNNLYFVSPTKYARFWAYPAKHAIELAYSKSAEYDKVYLSNRIDNLDFALRVYKKIDPITVQTGSNIIQIDDRDFVKENNIYIGEINKAFIDENTINGNDVLFILDVEEARRLNVSKYIIFKDNTKLLGIIDNNK